MSEMYIYLTECSKHCGFRSLAGGRPRKIQHRHLVHTYFLLFIDRVGEAGGVSGVGSAIDSEGYLIHSYRVRGTCFGILNGPIYLQRYLWPSRIDE